MGGPEKAQLCLVCEGELYVAIKSCDFGVSSTGDDVVVFLPEPLPDVNCTFVISPTQARIRGPKGEVISEFPYKDTEDGRIFECFKNASSQVAVIEIGKDGFYPGAATSLMWVETRYDTPENPRPAGRELAP